MYIADTNVISERKRSRVNEGVQAFFDRARHNGNTVYLSVVTVGELRRGVISLHHKGDFTQAARIDTWLAQIMQQFADDILDVDREIGELWAKLRVPRPENPLDKLIAATAIVHKLTVVTRNVKDFQETGVEVINPFD